MDGTVNPPEGYRSDLRAKGGEAAYRCYQCGTCTSVCDLSSRDVSFPRRQMALVQWGRLEALASDPSIWLCHQCNDCSLRCPREARPGDMMQTARSLAVEHLSSPRFIGWFVSRAAHTWPLLVGLPLLFWVLLLYGVNGLEVPRDLNAYEEFVPHRYIYAVFMTSAALAGFAMLVSGLRFWRKLDAGHERRGTFVQHLVPALEDILLHRRFGSCGGEKVRRWGHIALFWGFIGAAVTSGFIVVAMYGFDQPLPLPQSSWIKLLGNVSAIALVVGVAILFFKRFQGVPDLNQTSAFDGFFIGLVLVLVATGVLIEGGREWHWFESTTCCYLYILHLGVVLSLFLTLPFSKFAHMVYRTLAMVHERMIQKA